MKNYLLIFAINTLLFWQSMGMVDENVKITMEVPPFTVLADEYGYPFALTISNGISRAFNVFHSGLWEFSSQLFFELENEQSTSFFTARGLLPY